MRAVTALAVVVALLSAPASAQVVWRSEGSGVLAVTVAEPPIEPPIEAPDPLVVSYPQWLTFHPGYAMSLAPVVTGGSGRYVYETVGISWPTPPAGVTFNPATGVFKGKVQVSSRDRDYSFRVIVRDLETGAVAMSLLSFYISYS